MNDVRNRIPLAIKLADLFLVDIKRECDLMIVLGRFGVHRRYVKPALGSRVQDAHQGALCVAIANVKLHMCVPLLLCRFFFEQHFRKRRACRNHRENVGLGRAIKYEQLRLRRA